MTTWGVRPLACTLAVALLLGIAGAYGAVDGLVLVSLLALGLIAYLGVRAPLFFYLILERRGPRPDTNLWRWGVAAMLVAAAVLAFLTRRFDLLALTGIEVNLLYAGAKLGCANVGCCTALNRWRFVSINLPILEASLSLIPAIASMYLLFVVRQLELALAVAVAGHLCIRLLSYAARAERFALHEAGNSPDLVAALVVLGLTAALSYSGSLGA